MTNKTIRPATLEDSLSLIELNYKFNGVERTAMEVRQSLLNTNEIIVLAFCNDQAVGFGCAQYYKSFCYSEPHGEITELYVIEEEQGKGWGPQIICFLEERLLQIGVKQIKVLTGQDNVRAQKTYQKANYSLTDEVMYEKTVEES
ncbi:GNAT family N-acetyltransferase [Paenibacillus lutimineralis]|uniref:GNAT family N-acetyltransferase n=1 Tax=Paenibacillus lutimineralis TaxID=2707005 RepID=A0A3S9V1S4_9BACL|nr:GNAT family N-acetyltransferase [Paenibacillus lutimineralis]AZS16545.1 GNAT family N-acetyltransferase [Paenibacillus lutimineralis]